MTPRTSSRLPFRLPPWAVHLARCQQKPIKAVRERMMFVIALAATNVVRQTGGPFGAAVFESTTGRLVSIGVNLVAWMNCSLAHAEMIALANAQHIVGHFDLSAAGMPPFELVSSCEPCAMCYGALPWSGISKVFCGARAWDATAIGFDEGQKPKNWVMALTQRGIAVRRDLCRVEAVNVLDHYKRAGGDVYNARQGSRRR